MSERRSKKEAVLEYLTQAVFIVFSVLLALFLDAIRVDNAEREKLDQALGNIIQETQFNKEVVEELATYHAQVCENLKQILDGNKALDTFRTEFGLNIRAIAAEGVLQKFPSQTAWETSKLNNTITRLDFKRLQLLAKTYDQQVLTFMPAQKILDLVMTPSKNIRESLAMLYVQFNELGGRERQLLLYYTDVQKEFSDQSN